MEEEVQLQLEDTEEKMHKAVHHLEEELLRVRAGKATPNILDGITVDYYGSLTPAKPGFKYYYARRQNNCYSTMGKNDD